MNMKYLIIMFESARCFPKDKRTKDFALSNGKRIKRAKLEELEKCNFIEPITVHQISNMLHVMFGERPVPFFRKVVYDRSEEIFNIAKDSYLKLNSPKQYMKSKDVYEFMPEFIKNSKSQFNSWRKDSSIEWFKIEKYLGDDFDKFIEIFTSIIGYDPRDKPFMYFAFITDKYKKCDFSELLSLLKSIKKTGLFNFLKKPNSDISEITRNSALNEVLTSGIYRTFCLDGEIVVPVEESVLSKLVVNCAKILDGGLAEIVDIIDEEDMFDVSNSNEYSLVSDISDSRY